MGDMREPWELGDGRRAQGTPSGCSRRAPGGGIVCTGQVRIHKAEGGVGIDEASGWIWHPGRDKGLEVLWAVLSYLDFIGSRCWEQQEGFQQRQGLNSP